MRSFMQHLLQHDVTRAGQYGAILAIRTKRTTSRAVTYLQPEEARTLIAAIDDARSCNGERDRALLLLSVLRKAGRKVAAILSCCRILPPAEHLGRRLPRSRVLPALIRRPISRGCRTYASVLGHQASLTGLARRIRPLSARPGSGASAILPPNDAARRTSKSSSDR